MEPYDHNEDYCGPAGKSISKCISRYICGVDINRICYNHDRDYEDQVGKEEADKKFLHSMYEKIHAEIPWYLLKRYIALAIALRRYHMVKWFGQGSYDGT
jgi:hypothetical protein